MHQEIKYFFIKMWSTYFESGADAFSFVLRKLKGTNGYATSFNSQL